MTLQDLVNQNRLIEVHCDECRAKTPLDPTFFLTRRGNVELDRLRDLLFCTACGSADIELKPATPVQVKVKA